MVAGTTIFVLFHELGHAFISLYNLPATGREEDAVDQFATFLLASADDADTPMVERPSRFALLGAYFFQSIATKPSALSREILSDEHALGQQRYYDVMCMVYGRDSAAYQPVLTAGMDRVEKEAEKDPKLASDPDAIKKRLAETDSLNILPSARALRCGDEWKKYSASWEYMMEKFMKKPAKASAPLIK